MRKRQAIKVLRAFVHASESQVLANAHRWRTIRKAQLKVRAVARREFPRSVRWLADQSPRASAHVSSRGFRPRPARQLVVADGQAVYDRRVPVVYWCCAFTARQAERMQQLVDRPRGSSWWRIQYRQWRNYRRNQMQQRRAAFWSNVPQRDPTEEEWRESLARMIDDVNDAGLAHLARATRAAATNPILDLVRVEPMQLGQTPRSYVLPNCGGMRFGDKPRSK